jgi:hypothetical protein
VWRERRQPRGFVIVPVSQIGRNGGFSLEELLALFPGLEVVECIGADGTRVPSLRVPCELAPLDTDR